LDDNALVPPGMWWEFARRKRQPLKAI